MVSYSATIQSNKMPSNQSQLKTIEIPMVGPKSYNFLIIRTKIEIFELRGSKLSNSHIKGPKLQLNLLIIYEWALTKTLDLIKIS